MPSPSLEIDLGLDRTNSSLVYIVQKTYPKFDVHGISKLKNINISDLPTQLTLKPSEEVRENLSKLLWLISSRIMS
jgi:hypothetical protein